MILEIPSNITLVQPVSQSPWPNSTRYLELQSPKDERLGQTEDHNTISHNKALHSLHYAYALTFTHANFMQGEW